ncbi:hypothetical protein GeomeDRAFT_3329 [Geobacter metallireducens RCH3]|nr:hypothetical protein GeomeDRAFT_3329 [Geobacter metallireducens RCH3]
MLYYQLCQHDATIRKQIEIVEQCTAIYRINSKFATAIILDCANYRKMFVDSSYLLPYALH